MLTRQFLKLAIWLSMEMKVVYKDTPLKVKNCKSRGLFEIKGIENILGSYESINSRDS